jgi:hypothetical protein
MFVCPVMPLHAQLSAAAEKERKKLEAVFNVNVVLLLALPSNAAKQRYRHRPIWDCTVRVQMTTMQYTKQKDRTILTCFLQL